MFYSTVTFGFACTGPALTVGVSAGVGQIGVEVESNGTVYITATQYVRNDGKVTTVMGGRV